MRISSPLAEDATSRSQAASAHTDATQMQKVRPRTSGTAADPVDKCGRHVERRNAVQGGLETQALEHAAPDRTTAAVGELMKHPRRFQEIERLHQQLPLLRLREQHERQTAHD